MNVKAYVTDEILAARGWLTKIGLKEYELTKGNMGDLSGTDILIKTGDSVILAEIKIEDRWPYVTGNITLDAISAFSWKTKPIKAYDLRQLLPNINVHRWGTLYNSNDDILIKMIRDTKQGRQDFVAYDISKLQDPNFVAYVEHNCKIKVNPKRQYGLFEPWESAFFCVRLSDPMLRAAEIHSLNF